MSSLRIGVDVDDVLVESLPCYLGAFRERFGRSVPVEDAGWEIFERHPDITPAEMVEFFSALEAADFLGTRPIYPEAVAGIRALARDGHRLVVVTGRPLEHAQVTRRLLQAAGIAALFDEIVHRDGERAMQYKPRIARERGLNVLIEDELHVAAATAAVGVPVLLVDRPWNAGDAPSGVTRVHGWVQILDWVQTAARAGDVRC